MIEVCGCGNAGFGHEIKVDYLTRHGYTSTAYIDHRDGSGVDKHSNERLRLVFRDGNWHREDDRG